MSVMATVDRECDAAIRYRYTEIIDEIDDPRDLNDENVQDAATYGERPYMEGTEMPATECADRAYERALDIKVKLIEAADNGTLSAQLIKLVR